MYREKPERKIRSTIVTSVVGGRWKTIVDRLGHQDIVKILVLFILASSAASIASAQRYTAWSTPVNLGSNINAAAADSNPFIAPDNLHLFFTSDRAGGSGLTDIYVSTRASANAPWGTPVNLGPNVNSSATDSSPAITADGLDLFFFSDRTGGCGGADIYVSHRLNNQSGWQPAINLGCQLNSPQGDYIPSLFTDKNGTTYLYICTDRPGPGAMDIWVSTLQSNGAFGTPVLVEGLNTALDDQRPNIRSDGLEIFFDSNRAGTSGALDLYSATRATISSAWSAPVNLGATVNTASNDGRPSLSSDGRELYFGSNRPGGFGAGDIYVTRRSTFTPFDFDGDGKADVSVFRPNNRVWYLVGSSTGLSATQFGLSSDDLSPADYDGDGKTDIAMYRDGTWWILQSSTGTVLIRQFGLSGDIPQPADFDGDGKAEIAVYRNGVWWTHDLTNNQLRVVQFGIAADKPVAADYDGDGRADHAVYRDGVWYLLRSQSGYTETYFGSAADKPVPADYDGDGKTDVAVYRSGTWYLLRSRDGFTGVQFGLPTDVPAPADYDGDGKADTSIFRPSQGYFWINGSRGGITVVGWGTNGDLPIESAYVR